MCVCVCTLCTFVVSNNKGIYNVSIHCQLFQTGAFTFFFAVSLFPRRSIFFIIKEKVGAALKNACCGDSWQMTHCGTWFRKPRYLPALRQLKLLNLFVSLYIHTQVTMFKQAESWFKPHNDISLEPSDFSDKEIVLYSVMSKFSN